MTEPVVNSSGEAAEIVPGKRNTGKDGQPSAGALQKCFLTALRYLGIWMLLSIQVFLGVAYIFLLSSAELVLILLYAAVHLSRVCAQKLSVLSSVKPHTS